MKTFRRLAGSTALALCAVVQLADFARAVNLNWINAAGGFAGGAANWNPAQVPAAADWLFFGLANTYTVTFGANVPASDEIAVTNGDVTLRFPNPHTNSTVLALPGTGASADATIESGSLTLQRNLYVGQNAGSTGTLSVTGAGTSVTATSATGVTSIGDQGTGTLNVLDGATVTIANSPEFGDRAGGLGTLVIGGVSGTERAELIVNNSLTDPMEFGSNGTGNGGVIVGGRMNVAGSMYMARSPGGSSTFSVAGASGIYDATTLVGGDLYVAHNDVAGTTTGTATFVVGSGGIADVAGTTRTSDPDGGTGTVRVQTGGRFETTSLVMDDPATDLDLEGGVLTVRGGTLDANGLPLTVNSAAGSPVLQLTDGAQATLTSASGPTLTLGRGATGSMQVLSGADLNVPSFNVVLGDSATGTGSLTVDGTGSSITVPTTLIAGRSGDGTLDIGAGAQATIGSLRFATQIGADGHGTIRDAGTTAHVSDYFEMCGNPGGGSPTASATVTVSNGASLWLDRPADTGHLWTGSTLVAESGGTVHIAGQLRNRGTISLQHPGTVTGGVIQMSTDSRISGWGVISSAIFADADSSGRIQPSGHVTLGDPASPTGFHFVGALDLPGALNATLADADSAVVGTVNLGGGTLSGPSQGIHLSTNHRISGTGTVDAPVRVAGSLIPTGAAGLKMKRAVLGTGQGINGTRIEFAGGSSFVGNGAIAATVQVDSGAVILPSGSLTMGNAPLASSVTLDGSALVGSTSSITFSGTDSTRVNGTIALVNGAVTSISTSPIVLRPTGRITGRGNVLGRTISAGVLDPGSGLVPASLGFSSLVMQPGGHLAFDVGNWTAGQLDTVSSANPMTIAGTLDVRSLPGFSSVAGDSFPVLAYASRSGGFSDVTFNGQPAAGQLLVVYTPTRAWVKMLVSTLDAPGGGLSARELRFASVGSPARTLRFALELPTAADVTVELFDVGGRRLGTLHEGALAAGRHVFDGDRAAANAGGLYFARATVRGTTGATVRTTRAVRLP